MKSTPSPCGLLAPGALYRVAHLVPKSYRTFRSSRTRHRCMVRGERERRLSMFCFARLGGLTWNVWLDAWAIQAKLPPMHPLIHSPCRGRIQIYFCTSRRCPLVSTYYLCSFSRSIFRMNAGVDSLDVYDTRHVKHSVWCFLRNSCF